MKTVVEWAGNVRDCLRLAGHILQYYVLVIIDVIYLPEVL